MKEGTIHSCRQKAGLVGNGNTNNENGIRNFEDCLSLLQLIDREGAEMNEQEFFNPESEDECKQEFNDDFFVSGILV